MARDLRNVGASVRARLLERARAERADFQVLLTRYALERLLYRLGRSSCRDRFVLKGAMLFVAWRADPFRPTRDLDLLSHGDPDPQVLAATFRSICALTVPDDGVVFEVAELKADPIRDTAEYGGVRIRTAASIAGARVPIQVDVGFGDAVTPAPVEIAYPALLDAPAPQVRAYPVETVVAEKFEALVALGLSNSRMKDYCDLWWITRTFPFEHAALAMAIRRTFARRGTAVPWEVPTGLGDVFVRDKAAQWRAFLGRDRLTMAPADLGQVVTDLRAFLMPAVTAEDGVSLVWPAGGPWGR
jgi:hypothetical protein